jgi:hypothetical protein
LISNSLAIQRQKIKKRPTARIWSALARAAGFAPSLRRQQISARDRKFFFGVKRNRESLRLTH